MYFISTYTSNFYAESIFTVGGYFTSIYLWPEYAQGDLQPEFQNSIKHIGFSCAALTGGVTVVHCLYSAIFYQYLTSETSRVANEQLLNNLEEGVLIIEKENSTVHFLNTAA